jgi:hypothetical protein
VGFFVSSPPFFLRSISSSFSAHNSSHTSSKSSTISWNCCNFSGFPRSTRTAKELGGEAETGRVEVSR